MKTISEILTLTTDYLEQKQFDQAKRQAEDLICDALGIKRIQLYIDYGRPLNENELKKCRAYLSRRANREPLAYIHGSVDFLHCNIQVNNQVLIPRQETEILADRVIKEVGRWGRQGKVLWDVCCGSGCIGIAIKKHCPELSVELSDLSSEALAMAKKNAENNQVEVACVQGDLLQPFAGRQAHGIVCNPPYISEAEYQTLDREVRECEPQLALLAKNEGLEFYQRLACDLPKCLHPGGKVWLEIGYAQGEKALELFNDPVWKQRRLEKDWAGHSRFIFLEIE